MKIGCFALVQPFASFTAQLDQIRAMGLRYADLTDNHDGAALGVEFGFSASVSLDVHPGKIRRAVKDAGIELTSLCAHASLLDPTSPDTYGTAQVIKAIRLASLLGIKHVITTEGDPKTDFGRNLTAEQRFFSIIEKLQTPLAWAEELGVELLLEPHGEITTSPEDMALLLAELGCERRVGICLDTGNSWLGGADPVDFVRRFGTRIKHVHWKDLGAEWLSRRGQLHGCGMATIALGDGLVNVPGIVAALQNVGFDGAATLEVAGVDNILRSIERLEAWLGQVPSAAPADDAQLGAAGARQHTGATT